MTYISAFAALTGTTVAGDSPETTDWFNPVEFLGKKGTRLLPRGAQLTAACATLLPSEPLTSVPTHRRGVWVATSTFAEQLHETMDDIIRVSGSDGLSPAQAPYFSVNLVASRLSKDVRSHGMSTTITTPGTGLADALASAGHALKADRVDQAVIACTEVARSSNELTTEGCVSFLLNEDNVRGGIQVAVERGFAMPEEGSRYTPADFGQDQEVNGEHRKLVVFTDRSHSDPVLHSLLDLGGESIDACVYPLGPNMVAQGLELARIIEERQAATVFTICASGQWSRIHLNPDGGPKS